MLTDTATTVAAVAAGVAGGIYLARQLWRLVRGIQRVHELVTHELTHNGGGSMKDDLAAIATAVGQLQGDFRDLTRTKELAHELLQAQLDALHHELDTPGRPPRHREEGE